MRKREMSYSDYGITEDEVRYIKSFCQNSNTEEQHIIRTALCELNPYIAPYVFYSLVDNLSYEDRPAFAGAILSTSVIKILR